MKFVNKETGLQLNISEELVRKIAGYGINKYPNEFGGLLLGRYVSNNKVVNIEDIMYPGNISHLNITLSVALKD